MRAAQWREMVAYNFAHFSCALEWGLSTPFMAESSVVATWRACNLAPHWLSNQPASYFSRHPLSRQSPSLSLIRMENRGWLSLRLWALSHSSMAEFSNTWGARRRRRKKRLALSLPPTERCLRERLRNSLSLSAPAAITNALAACHDEFRNPLCSQMRFNWSQFVTNWVQREKLETVEFPLKMQIRSRWVRDSILCSRKLAVYIYSNW